MATVVAGHHSALPNASAATAVTSPDRSQDRHGVVTDSPSESIFTRLMRFQPMFAAASAAWSAWVSLRPRLDSETAETPALIAAVPSSSETNRMQMAATIV